MADRHQRNPDPTIARAPRGWWQSWLHLLVTRGRDRLGWFGFTLLLGIIVAAGTLTLFALLAERVAARETQRLDIFIHLSVQRLVSPDFTVVAGAVTMLGSELIWVFFAVLLILFFRQGRWGTVIALTLIMVGNQILNSWLKATFERERPNPLPSFFPGQDFSFPSGHAMSAATFYFFLMYLSWQLLRGWPRLAAVVGLLVLIVAIGFTRIYLGVHYFTDVIGGFLAGFLWADAVIIGERLLARRFSRAVGDPLTRLDDSDPVAEEPSG